MKPTPRLLMLLAVATLPGACASTPTADRAGTAGQVGEGITVNCSGPASGWIFCYRTASELCGNASYSVLKRDGDALAAGAAGESRTMQIKCN